MNRKLLFVVLFCIEAMSVLAQQNIKIWDGIEMTRKQKWSKLFIFLPEKEDTLGISVIICPGGSYYWLDMENEGFAVAKYLNEQGIPAFVLKYRTAKRGNHYPAMIQDLERAIQIVKTNSNEYGIHPEKIGIMGFSAGGHLAGTAAIYGDRRCESENLKDQTSKIKAHFVAMIYPVVSMEDSICHQKSRKNLLGKNDDEVLKKMMSLEKNVHADMPPIFLLHCTNDKTVDYRNSVVFAKALTAHNVKHKFLLINENVKKGHGFGIKPNGKATNWINDFMKFIKINITTECTNYHE